MDQMYMLEYFLLKAGAWAIVPVTAANVLKKRMAVKVLELKNGPPDRLVFCLSTYKALGQQHEQFLQLLLENLAKVKGVTVFKNAISTGIRK